MSLAGDTGIRLFKDKIDHESILKAFDLIKSGKYTFFSLFENTTSIKAFPNCNAFRNSPYEVNIDGNNFIDVKSLFIDKTFL